MNIVTTTNHINQHSRLRSEPLWLQYLNVAVLKRSLVLALIIGSILTLVTQSSALISDVAFDQLSLALAFVTPFVVITISQLVATHQAFSDANDGLASAPNTPFIKTLVAHNIPFRALMIGLIIGSTTSLVVLISIFYQTGDISNAPLSLLVQVYVLPVVFGALSQTLTYRRYAQSRDESNKSLSIKNSDRVTRHNHLLNTKIVRLKKEGTNVRYAELGNSENPSLILLHGVPENLQAWYAVAPLLSENYHVLALDWPGFGGSDPLTSPENYTSRHFAEVIIDFMDSLDIRKADLVATDIALLPALLAGLEKPSRVNKLVVMDGMPFPRPQYSSWELKSFARKGSIIGKALVNWFPGISSQIARLKGFYRGNSIPTEVRQEFAADGKSKSNQEAFLSYFHNFHMSQEYFETRAHELQTPVLVVWGKYDRFINSKLGNEIVEKLPNAKLKIIDKAGHYVHMDKPQALVQVVSEFLNKASDEITSGVI